MPNAEGRSRKTVEWEVLAEAIQTVMRRYGLPEPYEQLKALTRGLSVTAAEVRQFVRSLALPADAESRLLALTPASYIGLAGELVNIGYSNIDDADPAI